MVKVYQDVIFVLVEVVNVSTIVNFGWIVGKILVAQISNLSCNNSRKWRINISNINSDCIFSFFSRNLIKI